MANPPFGDTGPFVGTGAEPAGPGKQDTERNQKNHSAQVVGETSLFQRLILLFQLGLEDFLDLRVRLCFFL